MKRISKKQTHFIEPRTGKIKLIEKLKAINNVGSTQISGTVELSQAKRRSSHQTKYQDMPFESESARSKLVNTTDDLDPKYKPKRVTSKENYKKEIISDFNTPFHHHQ